MITQTCVEMMGLKVTGVSGFRIWMANHQKVKCLGVVKDLEVEAYHVKTMVDFHVMPAGLGAYPIILGRPWLRAVRAVQDWRSGTISLYGKTSVKRSFNMDGRKPVSEDFEDGDDSSSEGSSTTSDVDSDSTTSSEEDVEVAFLLVDEEHKENDVMALMNDNEEEHTGPYEVIEELMQPKMDVAGK